MKSRIIESPTYCLGSMVAMTAPLWEFEHAVECQASRSCAWSYWTDVSNWELLEGDAVEWIRLDGEFAAGASGETKSPGHDAMRWTIAQLDPQCSATIELPLDGALFANAMRFESLCAERTRIVQRMSLTGARAAALVESMRAFEANAPAGLAKLAAATEREFASQRGKP